MQEVKVMPLRERQFDVRSWAEAAEIVDALDKIIGGGNQGVSIAIGRSASYLGQCQTKDQIPKTKYPNQRPKTKYQGPKTKYQIPKTKGQ